MRPARTLNLRALGWTVVAALALLTLTLAAPLVWHLTVALWTSGAAWWLAAVAGVLVTCGSLAAAYWFRDELDKARTEAERAGRERDEALIERDIANALVEQWRADARVVRPLRSVPAQRDGSEYEWPRIARVLDIEEGEHA